VTLARVFQPITPSHLIALVILATFGVLWAIHYGIHQLHYRVENLPEHVMDSDAKQRIWDCVVDGGKWANWSLVPAATFVGYGCYVSLTTVSAHLHTRIALALLIGCWGASVIFSGFALVFIAVYNLWKSQKEVLAGMHFDPADPKLQGGIAPLFAFVEQVVAMWTVLSAMTWTVAYILMRRTLLYPFHERVVVGIVLLLEFLAAFSMVLVWWKGVLWFENERQNQRQQLAERVRQAWGIDTEVNLLVFGKWLLLGEYKVRSNTKCTLLFLAATFQILTFVQWLWESL